MAMTPRRILALIVVLAALALVVTARVPLDRGDNLTVALSAMYLAGLQSLVLLGAWIVALTSLGTRRDRAGGMLGVGLYALTMGVAFVPTEPLLYLSLLGAEALMLGAGLTAAGVLCLAGARTGVALGLAVLASALALAPLVAAISLMLPPPLWLFLAGVGATLLLVGLVWVLLRRWPLVKGPLILAAAADAFTLMVVLLATLVLRIGSAPSLSGYPSMVNGALALHGYPLVVMGIAISLVILDVSAHGLTMR
jgi:hypothetical protein